MLGPLRIAAIVATLFMLAGLPSSAVNHAPECASTGRLLRYVVLFDAGTPEQSARQAVRAKLDAALPDGLALLEGVPAGPGGLAERITASAWRIEVRGVTPQQLREAAQKLLAASEAPVERVTKDGRRVIDARAAIVSLDVEDYPTVPPVPDQLDRCGILIAVVRQGSPAVRPDDVLSALGAVAGLPSSALAKAIRTAQGWLDDDGGLVDPLIADRATARTALMESDDESDRHDVADIPVDR